MKCKVTIIIRPHYMFNNDIEHNVNCMIFLNSVLNDKYKGRHKERRVELKKEHMREDTKMRTDV